jgi:hypothetical protein
VIIVDAQRGATLKIGAAALSLLLAPQVYAQVRIEPPQPTAPPPVVVVRLTSWASKLAHIPASSTIPAPRTATPCASVVVLPDSLALVGGPNGVGSVDVWNGSELGWVEGVDPPTSADTLRARVVGADCGVIPLRVVLQVGTDYVAEYPGSMSPPGLFAIGPHGEITPAVIRVTESPKEIHVEAKPADELRHRGDRLPTAAESRQLELSLVPNPYRRLVRAHMVRIGMPGVYAGMSWGEPDHVNTTVVAGRTSEQWVYANGRYLYVDNGVVTAIQY